MRIDTAATYVSAAAARDGSFLVAYVPPGYGGSVKVDMSVVNKAGYAYWFDPTDGKYFAIQGSPISNVGVVEV